MKPIARYILFIQSILCLAVTSTVYSQDTIHKGVFETSLLENEVWWGGLSVDGGKMPYDATTRLSRNLWGANKGNQATPFLVSSAGRYVWSEDPVEYTFADGMLKVSRKDAVIHTGKAGNTVRDAFRHASARFFPSNGKIPDPLLFREPQYNTWIELMYDQNEKDILNYAQAIHENGYPSGVLMIDDNWQEDYGDWEFSARRFDNPKAMMEQLHEKGFKVMLWVCPFISSDSDEYRLLAKQGLMLLDPDRAKTPEWKNTQGKVAIIRWWNGASGLLDLSNPKAIDWFQTQLDHLVDTYGVDGFKLDAGDAQFYGDVLSFSPSTPNDHTTYFAEVGLKYPLNEYRASWKMAGLPLAQRLRDKNHDWADLQELIPGMIATGLMGYAYTCPDMIGGGQYTAFLDNPDMDEELIVRSAQVHALMPMMQFSVAPWRVLNTRNNVICRDMARLHSEYGDLFVKLARESSRSGEPIIRSLEYNYPDQPYERIKDQFMIGTELLVAPVVEKGKRSRTVIFPEGNWLGDDGKLVRGPASIEIDVPLERLPFYFKQ